MNPKISVVMSVYNGARFLNHCIDSVLKQTIPDFEFVIVDDCSTDNSLKIIQEYSSRDSRIKIIKNEENIGLTRSLNKGIRESRGGYIARIDADDVSYLTRFAEQVAFLDANKDHALVGSWAQVIDENDKTKKTIKYPTDSNKLKRDLIKYNPFFHSSIMIRRGGLKEIGLYNEEFKFAQDYELYFRIVQKYEIANLPRVLIKYRETSNSITSRKNRQQISFVIRAKLEAMSRRQYSRFCYVYFLKNFLSWLLPIGFKRLLKRI